VGGGGEGVRSISGEETSTCIFPVGVGCESKRVRIERSRTRRSTEAGLLMMHGAPGSSIILENSENESGAVFNEKNIIKLPSFFFRTKSISLYIN